LRNTGIRESNAVWIRYLTDTYLDLSTFYMQNYFLPDSNGNLICGHTLIEKNLYEGNIGCPLTSGAVNFVECALLNGSDPLMETFYKSFWDAPDFTDPDTYIYFSQFASFLKNNYI